MEKKQILLIVKGVALLLVAIGVIMILKQNLAAAIMIIVGTAAFYFAERN
jgi:hypothetical protein